MQGLKKTEEILAPSPCTIQSCLKHHTQIKDKMETELVPQTPENRKKTKRKTSQETPMQLDERTHEESHK
ncbi:hypothetical protein HNY73_010586 [Argiope bruennichi]|uniref:Uncharacterized protein n=1 Tax=Argiope bruennichi TaxID=94029 RepID=A0A8T0F1I4_ARGBR|nr:hypothetical protein HNY73_010586 [Argiope bruennichi]